MANAVSNTQPEAASDYKVLHKLKHAGKDYRKGQMVRLTQAQAQHLKPFNVVEAVNTGK
jgi:hypothetical protein